MKKILTVGALLFAVVLTLAGCGDNAATSASKSFNAQDVAFAEQMIPHHRQAVEMATLAQTRASDPQVKELAAQIRAAQGPEIATMTGWLRKWGKKIPSDSMHGSMGADHGMSSMPGMMSMDEMNGMEQATGAEFDRLFLQGMTRHHQGAVEMAKAEQTKGKDASAVALAKAIEQAQTKEIARMKQMLGS
jgi:uncharacterized protein (DUF305 family)